MVLVDLGRRLAGALQRMNKTLVVDESALDDCLKEICNALIESDVNVKYINILACF
jgi:signal recognition particle subunit SRP54